MDSFLENFSLRRLNKVEIEITNKSITSTEIKTAIKKKIPTNKSQGQMASQVNSIKHLEKN